MVRKMARTVIVRAAGPSDDEAIWRVMEPIIRAGETYPLASDMTKADALAYWNGPEDETFVVEEGSDIIGKYQLRHTRSSPGAHVANIGYMTSSAALGRGVGRRMVEHSLQQAREKGFKAFCSTSSPALTNAQLTSIKASASTRLGLFLS